MQKTTGQLILIPNLLGGDSIDLIPPYIIHHLNKVDELIVENLKVSRRYLVALGLKHRIDEITFHLIDKHQKKMDYSLFLGNALTGKTIGLMSDAGCPTVADPGAKIVRAAHRMGIQVIPLVGPSSILLALMGSGLNGQSFAFNGYLPIQAFQRMERIKFLEKLSQKTYQTQIFMETPYRNNKLLEAILNSCQDKTMLCVATDISLPTESILTQTIQKWRVNTPDLHKKPSMFLLLAFK